MVTYLKVIYQNAGLIGEMAIRMFLLKSAGTHWGVIWSIIQPISIVLVFYFVFAHGLKVQSPIESPFILWFICGLAPWFLISETIISSSSSIQSNVNLVKKTLFPTELFPVIHCLANLFTHAIFILILAVMIFFVSTSFSIKSLFFIYYLVSLIAFTVGISLFTSAIQPYYKDASQVIAIVLNILFWFTPIVWPKSIVPPEYINILNFNPIFYITEGYRSVLLENKVPNLFNSQTFAFWSITIFNLIFGFKFFVRLKKYFSDVV